MNASISKKICLIGDFAVGKTSLVRRFVDEAFSDDYLTTVGVKISTKRVRLPKGSEVKLIVWDIAGHERLSTVSKTYLQGASGYVLVADGTRANTLQTALALKAQVDPLLHEPPWVGLLNKYDLEAEWEVTATQQQTLLKQGWSLSSAKTGTGVEAAFLRLAEMMLP